MLLMDKLFKNCSGGLSSPTRRQCLAPGSIGGFKIRKSEDGMGLIEVLIAFMLLLIVMVPSAMLLTSTASNTVQLSDRSAASELATLQMSCIRSQPVQSMATEVMQCVHGVPADTYVPNIATYVVSQSVVGVGKVDFYITQNASWTKTSGGSSTSYGYKCLSAYVRVQWRQNGSTYPQGWPSTWPYIGTLPSTKWSYVGRSSLGACEPDPQLNISPGSASYDNWNGSAYFDASPGNTSPSQTFTLTVQPPSSTSESYDYVSIGHISISGSGSSDFQITSDSCSGNTIYSFVGTRTTTLGPTPVSCTFSVVFSPPASATPGQNVSANVSIPDNAIGSPQQIPTLSGYVSPDLFVVN